MSNFYDGKRILVTGGTGFLGQHLVNELSQYDCEIIVPSGINLTDSQQAISLFYNEGPFDMVFHLAAKCNGIKDNIQNGITYFTTNTLIDINVVRCCEKFKIEKLVAAGSVCMYPDFRDFDSPITEKYLMRRKPSKANYHYGMAKRNLYILLESYRHQAVFPVLSNLYGPGDYFFDENAHVIPSIITKFYTDKNPVLWGNGTPTRDFLFVKDAAKILAMAGAADIPIFTPFNVSPSIPTPVSVVAKIIAKYMGVNSYTWDTNKPNGTMHRHYDNEQMKVLLGDFEFTSFDDGINKTLINFKKELKSRELPIMNGVL